VVGGVTGAGSRGVRLRKALVTGQVAFSFLLLVAPASLCARWPTSSRLMRASSPWKTLSPSSWTPPSRLQVQRVMDFYARLLTSVRATPVSPPPPTEPFPFSPAMSGIPAFRWKSVAKDGEDMQAS